MNLKSTYARITGVIPDDLPAAFSRIASIRFGLNSDVQVLAVDTERGNHTAEFAVRKEVEALTFDEQANKFRMEKTYTYKRHLASIDSKLIARSPGSARDIKLLCGLLEQCGLKGIGAEAVQLDIEACARQFTAMYQDAQLGNVTYDSLHEKQFVGRYTAKSADNRADIKDILSVDASLRSIKFGMFHEGVRRSATFKDSALAVTSADEEDCEHWFGEMERLMLANCRAEDTPVAKAAEAPRKSGMTVKRKGDAVQQAAQKLIDTTKDGSSFTLSGAGKSVTVSGGKVLPQPKAEAADAFVPHTRTVQATFQPDEPLPVFEFNESTLEPHTDLTTADLNALKRGTTITAGQRTYTRLEGFTAGFQCNETGKYMSAGELLEKHKDIEVKHG